jgi:hypothetical protein
MGECSDCPKLKALAQSYSILLVDYLRLVLDMECHSSRPDNDYDDSPEEAGSGAPC